MASLKDTTGFGGLKKQLAGLSEGVCAATCPSLHARCQYSLGGAAIGFACMKL
jgi:hypothetical protein